MIHWNFYSVKSKLREQKMHTTIYRFNGHGHKGTIFIRKDDIVVDIEE